MEHILPSELLNQIGAFAGPVCRTVLFSVSKSWRAAVGGQILKKRKLCKHIAKTGRVKLLKWALDMGCVWTHKTASYAAHAGKHDLFKWAKQNGCPWDKHIAAAAVKNGDFRLVRWIVRNGGKLTEKSFRVACKCGHFEMVKWLWTRNCPGTGRCMLIPASNLKITKWLVNSHRDYYGVKIDGFSGFNELINHMAVAGNLEFIKWYARATYFRYPGEVVSHAIAGSKWYIVRWMVKNSFVDVDTVRRLSAISLADHMESGSNKHIKLMLGYGFEWLSADDNQRAEEYLREYWWISDQ